MTIEEPRSLAAPAVDPRAVDAALDALTTALGEEGVLRSEDAAREFRDPFQPDSWNEHLPSAAIQPASVEEVQATLAIANRYGVPLWTSSQGRNYGYGGAAPRIDGSLVLNLRRMDRIIEINEELSYAVLEPGVSFFQLVDELIARGQTHWASTPDLGWGSVVGNTLDHGFGYTEFGDHAGAECGLEVVLPDGDILRTGMGANPRSAAWHAHKRGFGPSVDSLFMQSNYGVVTKMGRWLTPRPEVYAPIQVKGFQESDLEPLVDTLRTLMQEGTISNIPLLGGVLGAAAMLKPRKEWYDGPGPLPESVYRGIMAQFGLGWWNIRTALYGPEGVVDAKLARIRSAFEAEVPGVEVAARKVAGDDIDGETLKTHPERVQAGRPSLKLLDVIKWWGPDGGHLDMSPVAPLQASAVRELNDLIQPEMEEAGFDFWPGAAVTPRSIVYLCTIIYDRSDEERVRAARHVYENVIRKTGRAGYGLYRGHIDAMDLISDQFDFNDHAMRRFTERIKDTIDPNGILSPGKQGIWPERFRGAGGS